MSLITDAIAEIFKNCRVGMFVKCTNVEIVKSYFLTRVKVIVSFINRGLKNWGIHIFEDDKVHPFINLQA